MGHAPAHPTSGRTAMRSPTELQRRPRRRATHCCVAATKPTREAALRSSGKSAAYGSTTRRIPRLVRLPLVAAYDSRRRFGGGNAKARAHPSSPICRLPSKSFEGANDPRPYLCRTRGEKADDDPGGVGMTSGRTSKLGQQVVRHVAVIQHAQTLLQGAQPANNRCDALPRYRVANISAA